METQNMHFMLQVCLQAPDFSNYKAWEGINGDGEDGDHCLRLSLTLYWNKNQKA